ncbi:hypothetical protein NC652_000124 [Populus alba x Populus x berolinensis]|nr:hypothetical protein NC652_000124 [Populus alba x Populus x berolinensis]
MSTQKSSSIQIEEGRDWCCQKMGLNGRNMAKSSSKTLENSGAILDARSEIVWQRKRAELVQPRKSSNSIQGITQPCLVYTRFFFCFLTRDSFFLSCKPVQLVHPTLWKPTGFKHA